MYQIKELDGVHTYSESPQNNKLRWTILFKEESEEGKPPIFTAQSSIMKCRDYFNDLVATYRGIFFSVYRFSNKVKLNADGVWIKLNHLESKKRFLHNLGSINRKAAERGFPPVTGLHNEKLSDECLIFLPRVYFECTYFISLLTYLIRIANSRVEVDSYEELIDPDKNPARLADMPFATYREKIFELGFQLPSEELAGNPWFLFKDQAANLAATASVGSAIHDNGVYSWHYYMQVYGFKYPSGEIPIDPDDLDDEEEDEE